MMRTGVLHVCSGAQAGLGCHRLDSEHDQHAGSMQIEYVVK